MEHRQSSATVETDTGYQTSRRIFPSELVEAIPTETNVSIGSPRAKGKEMNDMQESEIHPMDVAATEAIAQGWCEPETAGHEMDVVLAMAIAKPVSRLLRNWYDTAAQHCRNEEYYRGLVQEIGLLFGEDAFISDDGSIQQDVLCAKVPELVRARLTKAE